ncbi:MAG: hypothetical protein ABIR47_04995 [Candidatus Kapaibacterium sp.]
MRIRTLLFTLATVSILLPASFTASVAQPRIKSFGFGIMLGDPLAITLKGSLGGSNSWDAAIGSSWFGSPRVHADYLWAANVFNSQKAGMYFGLGGALGFGPGRAIIYRSDRENWYYREGSGVALGARVVGGMNFIPFSAPVEFFVEVAPIIGLVPAFGVGTDLALGVRYYP